MQNLALQSFETLGEQITMWQLPPHLRLSKQKLEPQSHLPNCMYIPHRLSKSQLLHLYPLSFIQT